MPDGNGSVNWTDVAGSGPLFVTVRPYVTFSLRVTEDGPDFEIDRSALGGTIEAGPRDDGGFRVLAVLPWKAKEENR